MLTEKLHLGRHLRFLPLPIPTPSPWRKICRVSHIVCPNIFTALSGYEPRVRRNSFCFHMNGNICFICYLSHSINQLSVSTLNKYYQAN